MGEFLPPMPHLHSNILSPLGTDLAKDVAFRASPSLVPMKSFLKGLFGGRRKKLFVRLLGTIVVVRRWIGSSKDG